MLGSDSLVPVATVRSCVASSRQATASVGRSDSRYMLPRIPPTQAIAVGVHQALFALSKTSSRIFTFVEATGIDIAFTQVGFEVCLPRPVAQAHCYL